MAALWILSALLVFTFRQGPGAAQITDPTEVEALKDIWRSLKDPYKNLSNWNSGDPCASNWTGVVCYNASQSDDSYLHVEELDLLNMNLSGILSPQLGRLSYLKILDFMWNSISGSIPKEIGNITTLELLLLNGNKLTGPLPDELGYLPNLDRIQIDQNQISGQLPKSFANLNKTRHFHMNNNSISGQIPVELSRLPKLVHFLLDNNNLSGHLPPEFSELPSLLILQVDNNNFSGTEIPPSYSNMSKLLKLSLRNCNLQGPIPDLSSIQDLGYLDLSSNQLNGSLQSTKFSSSITTIDLSNNNISGPIPEATFSGLSYLQKLSVANNELVGSISSMIWQNITLNGTERVILDFQNNKLSNISGSGSINNLPLNVSLRLQGNPICREEETNLVQFCGIQNDDNNDGLNMTNSISQCDSVCPPSYESWSLPPMPCFCAAPLLIGYRLKSPGFTYFEPYRHTFEDYLSSGLSLYPYQLQINNVLWQKGPRLSMKLKIFPVNGSHEFNKSELFRIKSMFTGWNIKDSDLFGPYELLNFTLLDIYKDYIPPKSSGLSKGALAGIVLGTIAGAVTLSAIVALILFKMHLRNYHAISGRRPRSLISIKIDGVKRFTYSELVTATNNFNSSTQIGQGGYGNVYKGSLSDGTMVAIKRAQQGSLQGEREFLTEIEFLSRLHHRNLVSLIGYCDEESEQMLVYEFMPNGTIRDHLSGRSNKDLSFSMRLKIALGSARGILYLHTEADPPIFHRDIKATNILLDSNFVAKVADFGLSRLAPVPDMDGSIPDHVSTVVKGTPGYLDPEYFLTHKLTDKSDVYSLGVVFMELFTGMQPISHGKNIVREVNAAYQSGTISSLIDSRMGSYPSECVEKLLKLALSCCSNETDLRPPMSDVVRELDTIWLMASTAQSSNTKIISEKEEIEMIRPSCSSSSYDMSSSTMTHTNVSSDVSGSDLVSGVHPTITPR